MIMLRSTHRHVMQVHGAAARLVIDRQERLIADLRDEVAELRSKVSFRGKRGRYAKREVL